MIYSLGGAGYRNFGDELMVRSWLDWWGKNLADTKIAVDGASREALKDVFGAAYPDLVTLDAVNRLAARTTTGDFWDTVKRGLTFYDRGGFTHYKGLADQAAVLAEAKVIHLHGGGYLNNHFFGKGFLLGLAVASARRSGARLIGTGLGLVPLKTPQDKDRAMVAAALEEFELIETRDTESADILRKLSPEARVLDGLDDTFMDDIVFNPDGKRRLHLSFNESRVDTPEFISVESYIKQHHGDYDEVLFWQCAPNDAGAWRRIDQLGVGAEKIDFATLVSKPIPVSRGDHMITARFHPHMIGARGGAVGCYYTPGQYYDVKHGSVVRLGSGFQRMDGGTLTPEFLSAGQNTLVEKASALVRQKHELASKLFPVEKPTATPRRSKSRRKSA